MARALFCASMALSRRPSSRSRMPALLSLRASWNFAIRSSGSLSASRARSDWAWAYERLGVVAQAALALPVADVAVAAGEVADQRPIVGRRASRRAVPWRKARQSGSASTSASRIASASRNERIERSRRPMARWRMPTSWSVSARAARRRRSFGRSRHQVAAQGQRLLVGFSAVALSFRTVFRRATWV